MSPGRMLAIAAALISVLRAAAPAGQPPAEAAGPAARSPRLAVILVIDQMRADYVDRFRRDWTSGLARILAQGAWFSHAAYPYLTTVTCPGHATVASGTFPDLHGIFQNAWFDRDQRRIVSCTEDAAASPIVYRMDARQTSAGEGGRPVVHVGEEGQSDSGQSARKLRRPTFADEMRTKRAARVVTLSLKARSAIMLAGRGGEAVTWLSDSLDAWETSSVFARGPVPAVARFVAANPIAADYGKTWTRLLPASRYQNPDAADGESAPAGWTALFPHVLSGDTTDRSPDGSFYAQWERSPFADAYLGRFAAALVESFQLGRGPGIDVLGVSFSTPDLVGHAYGPHSQEIQDLYARLDRTIGALLDRLDASVGRDAYVLALTSDHGVAAVPSQPHHAGQDAGRLNSTRVAAAIDRAARAVAGPGRYVARANGNDVYFEPEMYEKLARQPGALGAVITALEELPGIGRVFRREDLIGGRVSSDALLRAAALSYVPDRSGDLVLAPKPGWMFTTTATTHGTANPDDQRVPILLLGPGVRPGRYRTSATPADVAPTLAALCGITMPAAEGRPLQAALLPR